VQNDVKIAAIHAATKMSMSMAIRPKFGGKVIGAINMSVVMQVKVSAVSGITAKRGVNGAGISNLGG
jgi:hypothetical protein